MDDKYVYLIFLVVFRNYVEYFVHLWQEVVFQKRKYFHKVKMRMLYYRKTEIYFEFSTYVKTLNTNIL